MIEIKFWQDPEKKIVNPYLFSEVADKWAKEIKDEGSSYKNKISQIRKFYDEVLMYYDRLKNKPEDFEKYLPYIRILRAKVYYSFGRKHVTKKFVNFMEKCLEQINTWDDFEVYKKFFEAFMGFYRYYDK